jgi:hypothetical protein
MNIESLTNLCCLKISDILKGLIEAKNIKGIRQQLNIFNDIDLHEEKEIIKSQSWIK